MRTRSVLLWCAVVLSSIGLLSSCSDDSVGPGGPSGPSWVTWRNPHPPDETSYMLHAMWGSSSSDVYGVGQNGAIAHFDGYEWRLVRFGESAALFDVWGSSSRDVFCVGSEGTVLHYDGVRWKTMVSGTSEELYGVWGRSWQDLWAVGASGTALHFDGANWRIIDTGVEQTLLGVWGDAISVFAVGDKGTVLELRGTGARKIDVGTTNDLRGIGGSSATGLCAVGETGTILVHDGSTWRGVRSGTTADLKHVCGTLDGHLIAIGDGEALRSDGSDWGFMDVALDDFADVWGSSMRNLFVLGTNFDVGRQQILKFDGSAWTSFDLPPVELPPGDEPGATLMDVWGTSGSDVYAAGVDGSVFHYDGVDWTPTNTHAPNPMAEWFSPTVWGLSETEVYAVGNRFIHGDAGCEDPPCGHYECSIVSFDGTTWSHMSDFVNSPIGGIWGNSGDNLFAVGAVMVFVEEGMVEYFKSYRMILRYDGTVWNTMVAGPTPGGFNDVWGSSENDVFAVGEGGVIFHYDGSAWTEMSSGTTSTLASVWGSSDTNVVAVGDYGTIVCFDGHNWSSMQSGTVAILRGVWGSSMDDVFAVGEGGMILHYDGTRWSATTSPTVNDLFGVWGSALDDVFAVGEYGTICHYGHR